MHIEATNTNGDLLEGLVHTLNHLRESLVLIRNEADEKIRAIMSLERSLAGTKPVETRLGEK